MARVWIRATDLANALTCDRMVYLTYNGDQWLRVARSALTELLFNRGQEFERVVVDAYPFVSPRHRPDDLDEGYRATTDMMRRGADYIYQGVLMADGLVGIPDLLVRVDGDSWLGGYYYRPVDVKYASTATNNHRIQVMTYLYLLERVQGMMPDGTIWLRPRPEEDPRDGTVVEEIVVFDQVMFHDVLAQVRGLAAGDEPRPFISSTCNDCEWRNHCIPLAESAQDVSLLSGVQRKVWAGLQARGLGTLRALASASQEQLITIAGVGEKTAPRLIWQAQALCSGECVHLQTPKLERERTEIFFDVESVPFEGVYYLMGTAFRRGRKVTFEYDLAEALDQERAMWESFLRRIARTSGPVYHYGYYEQTALRALDERYGPDPRVGALRGRMVDLAKVLRESVVLPLPGYSLKDVAAWLGYSWKGETTSADDSVVEYVRWLEDGRRDHLENILHYNEDDCRATLAVCDWLASLG